MISDRKRPIALFSQFCALGGNLCVCSKAWRNDSTNDAHSGLEVLTTFSGKNPVISSSCARHDTTHAGRALESDRTHANDRTALDCVLGTNLELGFCPPGAVRVCGGVLQPHCCAHWVTTLSSPAVPLSQPIQTNSIPAAARARLPERARSLPDGRRRQELFAFA